MISTYLNLSFDLQERKQKEQQKAQKKKKKDGRPGTSESGCKLSEFPMSSNNPSLPQFVETCVEFIDNEGRYKGKHSNGRDFMLRKCSCIQFSV